MHLPEVNLTAHSVVLSHGFQTHSKDLIAACYKCIKFELSSLLVSFTSTLQSKWSVQANIHTHMHNAVTLVRGSLRLIPMSAAAVNTSIKTL